MSSEVNTSFIGRTTLEWKVEFESRTQKSDFDSAFSISGVAEFNRFWTEKNSDLYLASSIFIVKSGIWVLNLIKDLDSELNFEHRFLLFKNFVGESRFWFDFSSFFSLCIFRITSRILIPTMFRPKKVDYSTLGPEKKKNPISTWLFDFLE